MGNDEGGCELTGTLGFIVQAVLGLLAFSVLIIKRQYEKPKRQVKIWLLDTSKQGFSQIIAHICNVVLALILSNSHSLQGKNSDPCNWYFVTITFDTTVGVFICYILLIIIEKIFDQLGAGRLKTGNYFKVYTPDEQMALDDFNRRSDQLREEKVGLNLIRPVIKVDYGIWTLQVIIWVTIVVLSKWILYYLQSSMTDFLQSFSSGLFSGLDDLPSLKLIIVMVLIPLILNCFQFWIQDNILKKSEFSSIEEQYLTTEMFVDLELQDILKNDDHEASSTTNSSKNLPHNHNNLQNIKAGDFEFQSYGENNNL